MKSYKSRVQSAALLRRNHAINTIAYIAGQLCTGCAGTPMKRLRCFDETPDGLDQQASTPAIMPWELAGPMTIATSQQAKLHDVRRTERWAVAPLMLGFWLTWQALFVPHYTFFVAKAEVFAG